MFTRPDFSHLQPKDEVHFIDSSRYGFANQQAVKATVLRITPKGQINVVVKGAGGEYTRRFLPDGREIGGWGSLVTPERAAQITRARCEREAKRTVRDELEKLAKAIPNQTKGQTLETLRALLALAEEKLVDEEN